MLYVKLFICYKSAVKHKLTMIRNASNLPYIHLREIAIAISSAGYLSKTIDI